MIDKKKVRKAVIPAAGLGIRFLPVTKAQPKEMLPVVDKPVIQYVVEEAVAAGLKEILIVTGKNKRAIEDYFDRCLEIEITLEEKRAWEELEMVRHISDMADIYYVRQKRALGLGDAVYYARKFVNNEPFAVLLGDDIIKSVVPCTQQLLDIYDEKGGTIIGVQGVDPASVHKYGIVAPGNKESGSLYKVKGLVEKPPLHEAPSDLAVAGRYILQPGIFEALEGISVGANREMQLTDALHKLAQYEPVRAFLFQGAKYDIGDKLGLLKASVEHALERDDIRQEFIDYLRSLNI